jgi:uncharacterized protein YdeI (BOF family)
MRKNKSNLVSIIATPFIFGAVFFMVSAQSSPLNATTISPSLFAQIQPQPEAEAESAATTFTGKIVSQNGDRFILRDDANEVWYHLDDQQQAGKFLGKTVTVKGVLDGRSAMIHVETIVEAKA